ncbi:MAG: SAM-dependent methyltransferase, partial [Gemmatimonadetes bacterium]|nr:SAM-dependent methyltransferase [Gemmatimonadota bacterium]NIX45552.1 SAM-dependent methyltransferase [Gemmatimonadota bacterium]
MSQPTAVTAVSRPARRPGPVSRLARRLVQRRLADLGAGRVRVRDGAGEFVAGVAEAPPELRAEVTVHRHRFYRRLLAGGSLGAAAAYLDGDWDCDNLSGLFRATLRGLGRDDLEGGSGTAALAARVGHFLRRNTPAGSRRNIRDHYDLGNELFALFLDESMTYSSGIFASGDT